MDKAKFDIFYKNASSKLEEGRMRFLTELNIKCEQHAGDKDCSHLKTIVIEELSEMIQALTKSIRGNDNRENILEEFVDVCISMQYIIGLFDISEEEFNKAANVKLDRLERKIIECGKYE